MQTKIIYIVLAVLVLTALATGGYYLKKDFFSGPETQATSTPDSTPPTQVTDGSGGYTVEQVPVTSNVPAPDLGKPIAYAISVSPEMKKILETKVKEIIVALGKNSDSMENWLVYGNLLNSAGDYKGAIEAYDYVSLIRPGNIVSFGNAGDVYHYYLKDYPKAEANLKKVISNDPTYALGFKNLFDLYHLSYKKDTTLAEDTLKQGVAKLPKDINLPATLASYYLEKGREAEAVTYYEKALANAKEIKDEKAVSLLEAELAKLKAN